MFLTIFLFAVGFVLLIKGADMLVDGAGGLARRFGISEIVIGLTIVAFGTSMPELIVNILASVNDNTEIAVGNIIGSNVANVLLILGIAAVIYPLSVKRNTTYKEIPFALLSALVIVFLGADELVNNAPDSILSRGDGLTLLGFFCIFMYYIFSIAKDDASLKKSEELLLPFNKIWLFILLGISGLVIGGKFIVDGAVAIATASGVSQSLIGLTVVAIGTSLPELATSAVAAYKKNTDIAIGNVVGSNIFNSFWILGISSVIRPLPLLNRNNGDLMLNVLVSALLFLFLFIGKKHMLERWQGVAFIVMYACYLIYLIHLG
ncbi:MAG TPA: calcium/sodium antiporter [Bacteroidia bacterium]|nr:calcium/sodium antiporter [Bacteroidia bacterium]